jgi:hypothetical protein
MKGAIIWQKQEAEANDIGDEYHYIMSCGAIKGDRRQLLPNTYSPFDFYKSPEKILKKSILQINIFDMETNFAPVHMR